MSFEIRVGQQSFSVYHDIITRRSTYLCELREQQRHNFPDSSVIVLDDDPEVFATYLHTVYFGAEPLKECVAAMIQENLPQQPRYSREDSSDSNGSGGDGSDSDGSNGDGSDRDSDDGVKSEGDGAATDTTHFSAPRDNNAQTLFVGNISFEADESTLTQYFQEHGSINSIRLPTDRETGAPKGFGYVEMGSIEEAQAALEALQGADVAGRPIRLDYAASRDPSLSSGGGRGDNFIPKEELVEKFLVDLHLLAVKLRDTIAADLAVDELVGLYKKERSARKEMVIFVYQSTPKNATLRSLYRDLHIHRMKDSWLCGTMLGTEYPYDFITEVMCNAWGERRTQTKNSGFVYRKELDATQYHQVVDKKAADSALSESVPGREK